jgi:hypothetical protein
LLAADPLRVIPVTVTVIPVPTFAEANVAAPAAQLRLLTLGVSVQVTLPTGSVVVPLYTLDNAVTLGVTDAAVMLAVVVAVVVDSA